MKPFEIREHGPDTYGLYDGKKRVAVVAECDEKTLLLLAAAPRLKAACQISLARFRHVESMASRHGLQAVAVNGSEELIDAIQAANGGKMEGGAA